MVDDYYRRNKDAYESRVVFLDRDSYIISAELKKDAETYEKYLSALPEDFEIEPAIARYKTRLEALGFRVFQMVPEAIVLAQGLCHTMRRSQLYFIVTFGAESFIKLRQRKNR